MSGLVFGVTGQVASELRRQAPELQYLGRDQADLSNPDACAEVVQNLSPSLVINAAAYTAVDQAETDRDLALEVNGNAPGAIARACAEIGCPLVHISTDYVFDGSGKRAWAPDDPIEPINYYGASKAEGEAQIEQSSAIFAVLRTSWVFSSHGANFVKTMLRLSETKDALNIVSDQVGGPTSASDIASTCLEIVSQLLEDPAKKGFYHYSGEPDVSWADFAQAIFETADRSVDVKPIPSSDYPTPAKRPMNSRLDCTSTQAVFGISRPNWKMALSRVVEELGNGDGS